MTHSKQSQRGQAAAEASLALLVLVPMLVGIGWLGKLQYSALAMAQTSRKVAFASAQGQTPDKLRSSSHTVYSTNHWRVPAVGNGHAVAASLANDWLQTGRSLLRVQASENALTPSVFDTPHGVGKRLSVHRSTSILTGAGHALGDSATQKRIGESVAGWSIAMSKSRSQTIRLRGQLRRVDLPWQRGEVSVDWLGPWDDLIPTERLVRARSPKRR